MHHLLCLLTLQFMIGLCAGQLNSTTDANVIKFVGEAVTFTANYDPSQTANRETINWRFSNVAVARLVIEPDGSFTNLTLTSTYKTRLQFRTEKLASTYSMSLLFSSLTLNDNGIVVDVFRTLPSSANAGTVSTLSVIEFASEANSEISGVVGGSVTLVASYARSQIVQEELIVWRFDELPVANLTIKIDGTTTTTKPSTIYSSSLTFSAERSGVPYTMNLVISDLSIALNGTVVNVYRSAPTPKSLGNITTLFVSEPTTTAAATTTVNNSIVTTDSGSPQGNNTGTTSGNDSSSARSTISSITDEATGGRVATSSELSPGAIAGIVIGTVVGVLLILFLIWWFSEAFRSCLHDISDCFPEDHCCGKEYSKGSSS